MSSERLIYLDNNATTAVAPSVVTAMLPYLTEHYGNPSSVYDLGRASATALQKAREQVAALINADPKEIIFTSCGTESDNAAIWSALQTTGKKHIVTTQVEHSAVTKQCEYLEQKGYSVTWLPVRADGTMEPSEVEQAIHEGTAVVSIMWANNETGVLMPIAEIAEICRRRGVLLHTDAVQTPGKIPLDVRAVPVDFLALSGHKLHAPKGVGMLYVRSGVRFQPWLLGGSQERERRAGTENTASIVAFGSAAELAQENLVDEQTRVRKLRDHLENEILRLIPQVRVNGHRTLRLPNTSNLCFEGVEGEALLLKLNQHRICASAGSACTTGSLHPSHVLTAMGLSAAQAQASLRFSLSTDTTEADITATLEVLPRLVAELRELVPAEV